MCKRCLFTRLCGTSFNYAHIQHHLSISRFIRVSLGFIGISFGIIGVSIGIIVVSLGYNWGSFGFYGYRWGSLGQKDAPLLVISFFFSLRTVSLWSYSFIHTKRIHLQRTKSCDWFLNYHKKYSLNIFVPTD